MKSKKQKLIFIITVLALICCNNKTKQQINANQNNQNKAEEDMGYISKLNENVKREKVKYKNRYGLVELDLETQERRLKKSGHWFKELSDNNGF